MNIPLINFQGEIVGYYECKSERPPAQLRMVRLPAGVTPDAFTGRTMASVIAEHPDWLVAYRIEMHGTTPVLRESADRSDRMPDVPARNVRSAAFKTFCGVDLPALQRDYPDQGILALLSLAYLRTAPELAGETTMRGFVERVIREVGQVWSLAERESHILWKLGEGLARALDAAGYFSSSSIQPSLDEFREALARGLALLLQEREGAVESADAPKQ